MNWNVVMLSCVTVIVMLGIFAIILSVISARNMKKNRQSMQELQNKIQIGARILFGGGIYGKIVKIKEDVIDVELSKGLVIQISRYGIHDVVSN